MGRMGRRPGPRVLSGTGPSGRTTRIELGLWNGLLLDLWPRLGDEATKLNERVLALRIVQAAYDWAREYTPSLATVDLYREAGGRIFRTSLPTTGEAP